MQICYTNLKASISAEVGCFIKNLLEISQDILREYLIHLQEHMVNAITATTPGARNIHVMIEFLLIILTDMPKDLIHHDKLFDLLARVRALIKEVSTLVRDLEEKSRNKESTDKTSRATLDLLKNIELLKEDLRYVYLKAPDSYQCCFPMNDGPLFMHLLLIHLNGLLASNSNSIALIKEEIRLVKEALEFIRSFFVNVEQGLYKNLWARVLDVAYEAKDAIDSIIGRDNGLLHLIFSLPKEQAYQRRCIPTAGEDSQEQEPHCCKHSQESSRKKVNDGCEDIDVADKLRKQLYGKSHLIVLDDVWDTNTWDDLTRPFPEAEKGKESWELLEKRSFGEESCPDELLAVGKEISQNCKGLPLVADLIAGVIAGREKTKAVWLEVRNNLNSFILNSENVMKVIQLSYDHLPHQLKPCFLYLASYQRDTEIDTHWLKMYWRAEGIVEQTEMMSLEEVIEIYLDKLISSSLVIAFNEIDEPILIVEDLKFENLRILQTLVLYYSKETEDIFIRLPNLQRLVFDIKESWDYSPELYWFPNLDFLHELETLEVVFESSITNDNEPSAATNWSWDFHLPSNLKILSWLNFPLTYDSLSIIARLPNLEHLFLTRTIIKGGEWNMRDEDTLENLKFLMLDNVTLDKWEFGEESVPVLEKLQLWGCHMLEEIPPNFGDIGSLKIIQLVESPQLEDSALEIKEYVEDIMGRDLEFTPPSWRAAAMPSTVSFLLPNARDFKCATWLSASSTDEHASPVPLSRILKVAPLSPLNIGLMSLTKRSPLSICYSIRNEATFTQIHFMETITLARLHHNV
ncbi:hypothetical protein CQW23_13603 [Capsicum baccatum]|uniref:NB-ARC domain-containing protein n=1 Tax=Capsicum baccatum TaxID=33114 RepID=A0A2G2WGS3_CAPBA|nr:hypothetical protein CQW23_13603 [Capsicum baccatum]